MKRARVSSRESRASSSSGTSAAHSLYAAALEVSRIEVSDEHILDLRITLCAHLQVLLANGKQIAGRTVDHWAWIVGLSADDYVADTAVQRPGNSADLWLLASILGVTLWLYGTNAIPIVFSHPGRPTRSLCVDDGEYSVIWTPQFITRLPTLPLLPMDPTEVLCENHACDLRAELCCTRRNHMWNKMVVQLCDLQDDNVVLTVCHYRFLPLHAVHCRVLLAVPSRNSQLQFASIPDQDFTLCVNGFMRTMSLPAWTSLVRVIVEVDHPDVEWLSTDDIVLQTRTFLYHQIENIYDGLLETHTRHRQAHRNAIAVLEKTLESAPAIFTRFVHKFAFFTSASTDRITFQEFLRFHRLYVFSQSPVKHMLPGFTVCNSPRELCLRNAAGVSDAQPLLLLTRDQVSVVVAAIQQKFDERLAEHPLLVHGGGAIAVCPLRCGAGRFQKVQHDTVARSALALLLDDMKLLQYYDIPQPLLEHLCLSDKKCALAVFQAKSRAQRLRALGAALRRIGMVEMAERLPLGTVGGGDNSERAAASRVAGTSAPAQGVAVPTDSERREVNVDSVPAGLAGRVAALEVWAHSLDSVQVTGDDDSAGTLTRASALVRSLVQQAVRDYFQEHQLPTTPSVDQHPVTEAPRRLEVNEFMLADKVKQLEEQVRVLGAKSSAVGSVTVFDCPSSSDGRNASESAAITRQVQQDQLLGMHTDAISRTWQWTSSVILAMMQQRSTNLHMQQSIAALESRLATLLDAGPVGVLPLPPAPPQNVPTPPVPQMHLSADGVSQEVLPVTSSVVEADNDGTLRSEGVSGFREDEPQSGNPVHGTTTDPATDQIPGDVPESTELPTLVVSDSE
eukprot:6483898-Amphidinium_carterae.1